MQCVVPVQWKVSRISLIPKIPTVRDFEKDLRPIAITCPISKVAEVFVARLFDEFYDDSNDVHQYGSVKIHYLSSC